MQEEEKIRISIHAPREGSDRDTVTEKTLLSFNFYPRSPRGERQIAADVIKRAGLFLSTLPARGATGLADSIPTIIEFLSTLPARGATA